MLLPRGSFFNLAGDGRGEGDHFGTILGILYLLNLLICIDLYIYVFVYLYLLVYLFMYPCIYLSQDAPIGFHQQCASLIQQTPLHVLWTVGHVHC